MLTKDNLDQICDIFGKAFHEVVPPILKDLEERLRAEIRGVQETVDRIERTLEKTENRQDRQGKMLDNYEERIEEVEKRITTPQL